LANRGRCSALLEADVVKSYGISDDEFHRVKLGKHQGSRGRECRQWGSPTSAHGGLEESQRDQRSGKKTSKVHAPAKGSPASSSDVRIENRVGNECLDRKRLATTKEREELRNSRKQGGGERNPPLQRTESVSQLLIVVLIQRCTG